MLKMTILSENRENGVFCGESGLSIVINAFNNIFLLDTGYSDLFLKNAQILNIDINNINQIVLTHGHSDHSHGLKFLEDGKTIILHPASYKDRWSKRKLEYVGLPFSEQELKNKHNVIDSKQPLEFYKNCYFLGEIPMTIEFEKDGNFSTTLDEQLTQTDYTEDDSGVVFTTDKGLFIITGCGHRGVCNTIEHAKTITNQNKIYGVVGGFHLRNLEKQKEKIDKTIEYFKQNNIKELYLGHCVTDDVIDYFESHLENVKIVRLASGKEFEIDLNPLKK